MQKLFSLIILAFIIVPLAKAQAWDKKQLIEELVSTSNDIGEYKDILDIIKKEQDIIRYLPNGLPIDSVTFRYSSAFGWRIHPKRRKRHFHSGLDIACDFATRIYASACGVITFCGYRGGYGNMVEIDHKYGYKTRYAHLSHIYCSQGDTVTNRTIIGFVGSTGVSTGDHLHYEIIKNGNVVNPRNHLFW